MSTVTANTFYTTTEQAPSQRSKPTIWQRMFAAMIASREARATVVINQYLCSRSDAELRTLGKSDDEIARLRRLAP